MTLDFDFRSVRVTEFGVGRDEDGGPTYNLIPVDGAVQAALREMAAATWAAMQQLGDNPPRYEASEKYESSEYVHLPLDHDLAKLVQQLHQANNLSVDVAALSDPSTVFCYFARMTDKQGRHLTALRRATQFKGVLKSRLIRLTTDALRIIEDRVFKLDSDFDLLIDDTNVHILRPSGFEFLGKLKDAVLAATPQNVKAIQGDLPFVDFAQIEGYASKHPRAARYLASIRSQKETKNIDKRALKRFCKDMGVQIQEANGKITVQEGHEMGFLEVLDRRRYGVELVKDTPERFRAMSRRKLGNEGGGET
jgi:hypothetical protein